jgi:NAD(P)-dependent dehydrogenase (short-subunit alcohol dehydrogenase family)
VFYTVVVFLGLLVAENKKGNPAQNSQILVTSSVAGFNRLVSSEFAYHTLKAVTHHLMKKISTHFNKNNLHIRANILAPGMFPSEMKSSWTKNLKKFEAVHGHEATSKGRL